MSRILEHWRELLDALMASCDLARSSFATSPLTRKKAVPTSDESDDPVRRTQRQLRCYYRCVAHDEDNCPDCAQRALDDLYDPLEELDDDDELGLPRY